LKASKKEPSRGIFGGEHTYCPNEICVWKVCHKNGSTRASWNMLQGTGPRGEKGLLFIQALPSITARWRNNDQRSYQRKRCQVLNNSAWKENVGTPCPVGRGGNRKVGRHVYEKRKCCTGGGESEGNKITDTQ